MPGRASCEQDGPVGGGEGREHQLLDGRLRQQRRVAGVGDAIPGRRVARASSIARAFGVGAVGGGLVAHARAVRSR
jgi:hypothetical protein